MRVFVSHVDTIGGKAVAYIFHGMGWDVYGNLYRGDRTKVVLPSTITKLAPKPDESMDEFRQSLLSCDVVIYDTLIPHHATCAAQLLYDSPTTRIFILLSTIMAWARTQYERLKSEDDEGEDGDGSDDELSEDNAKLDQEEEEENEEEEQSEDEEEEESSGSSGRDEEEPAQKNKAKQGQKGSNKAKEEDPVAIAKKKAELMEQQLKAELLSANIPYGQLDALGLALGTAIHPEIKPKQTQNQDQDTDDEGHDDSADEDEDEAQEDNEAVEEEQTHGIKQEDARKRRPAPTFQARAQLSAEKRIEKLLVTKKENSPGGIVGKIIVCGVLYGVTPGVIQNSSSEEEEVMPSIVLPPPISSPLSQLYLRALLNTPEGGPTDTNLSPLPLPMYGGPSRRIPTCHALDVGALCYATSRSLGAQTPKEEEKAFKEGRYKVKPMVAGYDDVASDEENGGDDDGDLFTPVEAPEGYYDEFNQEDPDSLSSVYILCCDLLHTPTALELTDSIAKASGSIVGPKQVKLLGKGMKHNKYGNYSKYREMIRYCVSRKASETPPSAKRIVGGIIKRILPPYVRVLDYNEYALVGTHYGANTGPCKVPEITQTRPVTSLSTDNVSAIHEEPKSNSGEDQGFDKSEKFNTVAQNFGEMMKSDNDDLSVSISISPTAPAQPAAPPIPGAQPDDDTIGAILNSGIDELALDTMFNSREAEEQLKGIFSSVGIDMDTEDPEIYKAGQNGDEDGEDEFEENDNNYIPKLPLVLPFKRSFVGTAENTLCEFATAMGMKSNVAGILREPQTARRGSMDVRDLVVKVKNERALRRKLNNTKLLSRMIVGSCLVIQGIPDQESTKVLGSNIEYNSLSLEVAKAVARELRNSHSMNEVCPEIPIITPFSLLPFLEKELGIRVSTDQQQTQQQQQQTQQPNSAPPSTASRGGQRKQEKPDAKASPPTSTTHTPKVQCFDADSVYDSIITSEIDKMRESMKVGVAGKRLKKLMSGWIQTWDKVCSTSTSTPAEADEPTGFRSFSPCDFGGEEIAKAIGEAFVKNLRGAGTQQQQGNTKSSNNNSNNSGQVFSNIPLAELLPLLSLCPTVRKLYLHSQKVRQSDSSSAITAALVSPISCIICWDLGIPEQRLSVLSGLNASDTSERGRQLGTIMVPIGVPKWEDVDAQRQRDIETESFENALNGHLVREEDKDEGILEEPSVSVPPSEDEDGDGGAKGKKGKGRGKGENKSGDEGSGEDEAPAAEEEEEEEEPEDEGGEEEEGGEDDEAWEAKKLVGLVSGFGVTTFVPTNQERPKNTRDFRPVHCVNLPPPLLCIDLTPQLRLSTPNNNLSPQASPPLSPSQSPQSLSSTQPTQTQQPKLNIQPTQSEVDLEGVLQHARFNKDNPAQPCNDPVVLFCCELIKEHNKTLFTTRQRRERRKLLKLLLKGEGADEGHEEEEEAKEVEEEEEEIPEVPPVDEEEEVPEEEEEEEGEDGEHGDDDDDEREGEGEGNSNEEDDGEGGEAKGNREVGSSPTAEANHTQQKAEEEEEEELDEEALQRREEQRAQQRLEARRAKHEARRRAKIALLVQQRNEKVAERNEKLRLRRERNEQQRLAKLEAQRAAVDEAERRYRAAQLALEEELSKKTRVDALLTADQRVLRKILLSRARGLISSILQLDSHIPVWPLCDANTRRYAQPRDMGAFYISQYAIKALTGTSGFSRSSRNRLSLDGAAEAQHKAQERTYQYLELQRSIMEGAILARNQRLAESVQAEVRAKSREARRKATAFKVPLYEYFSTEVSDVLMAGLLSTAAVRPEDPVRYLADYLLAHKRRDGGK